jgi:hypothetical protein
MDRSKLVAMITGAIAILLSVIYLLVVQLLDFRGEMVPAPMSNAPQNQEAQLAIAHPTALLNFQDYQ